MVRILQLPQGDISYELTRKKVKNINLRIRPDGSIAISAAKTVPLSAIEDFIRSKEAWIRQVLSRKQPQSANLSDNQAYLYGNVVVLPENMSREQWQKAMADTLLHKQYELVWPLFQGDGFAKPQLRLRKMKSRWGSCIPAKGCITLNTALIAAPEGCIQAVIAHELAHMRHPNHQKDFYAYLHSRMPNYQQHHRLLRELAPILLDSSKS